MSYTEAEIQQQLQKILKSNAFIRSKINQDLLSYLVQETLAGNRPKELAIEIDVFQKDNDTNSSNTRVYVGEL